MLNLNYANFLFGIFIFASNELWKNDWIRAINLS